ncbi:hypothetical protein FB446DRAFT_625220, partial [Lentinula raphanica]
QDMLCSVNVQHHCFGNKCLATGTRPAYQERAQKGTDATIVHNNPDDLILNICQMHHSLLVQ